MKARLHAPGFPNISLQKLTSWINDQKAHPILFDFVLHITSNKFNVLALK